MIEDAVRIASSDFKNPVKPRQVWYIAGQMLKERFSNSPEILEWLAKPDNAPGKLFCSTHLKDYQEEHDTSHWPMIDIDGRGSASEPHDGLKNIQLSTSSVCQYIELKRGGKNFGGLIYIEKEQFRDIVAPVLREFDLFILESKGQGTIAEKKLLLWAEEQGLPIFVFSDCDVAGHMIHATIKKGTKHAPAVASAQRIGLTLEQAERFGLRPEPKNPGKAHLTWLGRSGIDDKTKTFLRAHRFELNFLNTEQMNDLLREELTKAGLQKVIPSEDVVVDYVRNEAKKAMRKMIMDHAGKRIKEFADKAAEGLECLELIDEIREHLEEHKQESWEQALNCIIEDLEIISKPLSKENP